MDIKRLISEAVDAFDRVNAPDFPLLVGNNDASGNQQAIDFIDISHLSHLSHHKTQAYEIQKDNEQTSFENEGASARASRGMSEMVGKVGKVGNASNGSDLFFPLTLSEVGKVGKANPAGGSPLAPPSVAVSAEPEWVRDHAASLGGMADADADAEPIPAGDQMPIPASPSKPSKGDGVDDEPPIVAEVTEGVTGAHAREGSASHRLRAVIGLPAEWIDGALALSPDVDPCPGFRSDQWPRVYAYVIDFLTGPLALDAVAAGWTTLDLFGVHPEVGVANVSAVGACLLVDHDRIRAVSAAAIRFDRSSFYRRPVQNPSIPVWSFGR